MTLKTTLNAIYFIFIAMETWKAIIKEKNTPNLLTPTWSGEKFEHITDPNMHDYYMRTFLENFWGLRRSDVEWYKLEQIRDEDPRTKAEAIAPNQVTAFMLYIYNKWCIGEAKKVFGENLGEHLFSKYLHHRGNLGELFWYSELDNNCRRKIVERAVEIYGKESIH